MDTFVKCQVDVLIVGAGPAGCMAASTLARYGISFQLIDKRAARTQAGHASAFQPRTQEILQTLNLRHKLDELGHRHSETAFWAVDETNNLIRGIVGREVVHATPYQYLFNSDQGITESVFEDDLRSRGHKIGRYLELIDYEYPERTDPDWPLVAYIKNHISGAIEAWQTKYILGTDGARSMIRRIAGVTTQSQGGEDVWAVADIFLSTDFPDYRRRCAIRSPHGGCMLIPRKDDGIRVFLQLTQEDVKMLEARKQSTDECLQNNEAFKLLDIVQSQARKVLSPYKFEITKVLWISRYTVSQRVVDTFRDKRGNVFLLGDACHTHSPKAGQGMNVSISDAYNLTWKLALVMNGLADAKLLDTYECERKYIAMQLIDFDAKFAKAFTQTENPDDNTLQDLWEQNHGFTSGCGYCYPKGLLVSDKTRAPVDQTAMEPLIPGKRLLSISLVRQLDGNLVELLNEMPADARFHLFVYAGKCLVSDAFIQLSKFLSSDESPLYRFNKLSPSRLGSFHQEDITSSYSGANSDYLVDVFLIHTSPHLGLDPGLLPAPFSDRWSSRVYEDTGGRGHATHGISEEKGALVVVRPDGYISLVAKLDQPQEVVDFLKGFLFEWQWLQKDAAPIQNA